MECNIKEGKEWMAMSCVVNSCWVQCLEVAELLSSSGSDMWGKAKKSARYNVEHIFTFSVQERLAIRDQQDK